MENKENNSRIAATIVTADSDTKKEEKKKDEPTKTKK